VYYLQVSRGPGSEQICKIHIPTEVQLAGVRLPGYIRRSNEVRFDATLVFSDNTQVTILDKSLCLSFVLIFVSLMATDDKCRFDPCHVKGTIF